MCHHFKKQLPLQFAPATSWGKTSTNVTSEPGDIQDEGVLGSSKKNPFYQHTTTTLHFYKLSHYLYRTNLSFQVQLKGVIRTASRISQWRILFLIFWVCKVSPIFLSADLQIRSNKCCWLCGWTTFWYKCLCFKWYVWLGVNMHCCGLTWTDLKAFTATL